MKKLKNFVRVLFAMIFALTLSNTQTVEAASDTVVIYEVYGGGDSNGAVYKYDYVVLKNVSDTTQSLDGLYLHKGTAKGAWFDSEKVALKGEIAPGAYFVFRGEQPKYKTNGKGLPRFDQSAKMQIASSKFAIALTKGSQAPSQTIGGNVIDLVGTNSLHEAKPASGANAITSIVRKSDKDTDDNSVDFTTKTHNDGSEPLDYVNETDDSQPEDEKINIYFNPNGGKLPAAYDQYTADEYGDIAVPFERDAYHTIPLPTREGFVFTGYDVDEGTIVDEDGNEQEVRNFLPETDKKYKFSNDEIILTAQWQEVLPEESTVTIDPNDGEMLEDKAKTIVKTGDAYTIDFEGKYKFYKDGYHFDGFDVEGQLEDKNGNKVEYIKRADPFTDYYPKSDVTLKVRWKVMEGGQFRAYVKREDGTAFSGTQYKLYLKGTETVERRFPYGAKREAQTHKMSLLQLKNDSYTLRVEGLADDEFIKEVRLNEDKYTQNQADTKIELTEKDKAKIAIKYDSHFIAPEVNFDVIIGRELVEETYTFTLTGEGVNEITVPGFTRKTEIKLKDVNREGYKFIGWKVEGTLFDSEGKPVTGLITNFDQSYYPGSDVVFTALWEKEEEKATVTFAFNKAIDGVDIPEAQKVEVGTEITLPEVNPEVKDGYSFLGWVIGDNKYATANLKPGDKITVEEDTNVMGIWEGAYGKVKVTFHTGEFIDSTMANRDNITKLNDQEMKGAGFSVTNQDSKLETQGNKGRYKGEIEIANGLVKGNYTLNITAPEGYEIVKITRDTNEVGGSEITNESTISLPKPEAPFNLTMVDSIYVEVKEKEAEKVTVNFEFDKNIAGAKLPDPITVPVGTEIKLPSLDEEVLGEYSFMGWELDKAYPNKADANPGDTIKVTEDMTVKGYWEGRYGRFAVHFHEGDYFENKDNLQTLTEGFGFATINPIDKTRLEGVLAGENSKNPYFITPNKAQGGGLTKDAYDLEFTIPEGYRIVSIDKVLADGGLEEVNIGERISPYWYPFNLTMVRDIYVQVEKVAKTYTVRVNGATGDYAETQVKEGEKFYLQTAKDYKIAVKEGEEVIGFEIKKGSLKDKDGKTLNVGDIIKAPANPWTKPQFEALSDVELEPIIKKTSGAILIEVRDDDVHTNPDAYKLELEDENGNVYSLLYDSVSQDNKGKFVLYGYEKVSYTDGGRLDSGSYTLRIKNDKNRSLETLEVAPRPNSVKSSSAKVVDGIGQISVDFDQSSGSLPLVRLVATLKDNKPAIELPEGLYIYEIYGGGGLQQSYYANDYVVLQNKSDRDIDLSGINLHVSNAWRPEYHFNIPLSGTIKANDYYVIKAGAGFKSGEQKELPRVDLDLSGGKLYQNDFDYQAIGLALTKGSEEPNEKNTIDMVGTYKKNQYLVKPATSPHVDRSIRRIAYDDVNKTDFEKVSHRPYVEGTADHREPLWYLSNKQEEKVTVTFAHNVELTSNETPAEQNVWSGTKITLPQVKEEEKFEFKGWDVDGDGQADKAAGEEFEVKENLTITGIWEEIKPEVKTINFVVDPEKGSATGALFAEVIEGEDPLAKAPKVEAKEGYKFVEWKTSEDGLTYTAVFEEEKVDQPQGPKLNENLIFTLDRIEGDKMVLISSHKIDKVLVKTRSGEEIEATIQKVDKEIYTISLGRALTAGERVIIEIIVNNEISKAIRTRV